MGTNPLPFPDNLCLFGLGASRELPGPRTRARSTAMLLLMRWATFSILAAIYAILIPASPKTDCHGSVSSAADPLLLYLVFQHPGKNASNFPAIDRSSANMQLTLS
jgi:hypothetical protein